MIRRRRRPVRETFSLDSFLDLVTNVVGIIIRLILVAWIGARAYNNLPDLMKGLHGGGTEMSEPEALPADPLQDELARQRQELAQAEARMLEQLRQNGVKIEKIQDFNYGRFAWIMDPEGNRIELWEPKKK